MDSITKGSLVRRMIAATALAGALLLALAGPATAEPAAESTPPTRVAAGTSAFETTPFTIFFGSLSSNYSPTTWLNIIEPGGLFEGLPYVDGTPATAAASNQWVRSTDSYIGPGGHRYYQYKNVRNNYCLKHSSGLVITTPCVWGDNSQWWGLAVQWVIPHVAEPGSAIQSPVNLYRWVPWDDTRSPTEQDTALVMTDSLPVWAGNVRMHRLP
ncbi:hypothetical protein [Plantactinospora sp. GCM10030261]|uniref:hypothetical protein n=1 Tax=Plantactinospora sp. GCM10030261 TaxID=3273420 RepID=UPI003610DD56